MIIKNSILKNKYYIILLIILFTSVDTILFGTNGNRTMNYLPRFMALVGIIFLMSRYIKRDTALIACITMVLISSVSNFIYDSDLATLITRVLFIILAYLLAEKFTINNYFKVYDFFMYFVSIFALLMEFIVFIFPNVVRNFFVIVNTSGTQFYSLGFASILSNFVGTGLPIRASGIFWEPGAFAVYLVIALMGQLYVFKSINIKHVVLYLISLLLTFSTTGIFAGAMLIFTYTFYGKNNNKNNYLIRCITIILIILIIVLILFGENTMLYNTIFGKIINGDSTAKTRYASFLVPFAILLDYPLLGVSGGNISELMRPYTYRFGNLLQASNMCTNTLSYQFGAYGLLFGLLFVIGTIKFCKKISCEKKIVTIGLFFTFFFAYFGENFFSFFPYIFVFLGFKKNEI